MQLQLLFQKGLILKIFLPRLQEQNICTSEEFINAVKSYPLPSYVKDNSEKKDII